MGYVLEKLGAAPAASGGSGRGYTLEPVNPNIYEAYAGPETGGFGLLPQSAVPRLSPNQNLPSELGPQSIDEPLPFGAAPTPTSVPLVPRAMPLTDAQRGVPMSGLTVMAKGGVPREGTLAEAKAMQMAAPLLQPLPPPPTRGQAFGRALFNSGLRMFTHLPNAPGNIINTIAGTDVVEPFVTAEPEELRGAFTPGGAEAQFTQSAQYRAQRPWQTFLGETGADVAALGLVKQPVMGPLRGADIKLTEKLKEAEYNLKHAPPAPVARNFSDWAKKKIEAPRFFALSRGGTRIGEATAEGLVLGVLNDQDPISTAAMAASGQAVGSGILHLSKIGTPTPYKSLNIGIKALGAGVVMQLLTSGFVLPDIETGFEKVKLGIGAALVARAAGAGRARGDFSALAPRTLDTLASVPRQTLISIARQWQNSDVTMRQRMQRTIDAMAKQALPPETISALSRAMDKGGATFVRVMDRLVPDEILNPVQP